MDLPAGWSGGDWAAVGTQDPPRTGLHYRAGAGGSWRGISSWGLGIPYAQSPNSDFYLFS